MARVNALLATIALGGIAALAVGCGSSSRLLQTVLVTPATADAQSFPNGQVQFTAMGTYSQPPSPATLTQALWSLDSSIATVSQSGLAQCVAGASGVVTVTAGESAPCTGTGCTAALIRGTAQLTCP